MAFIETSFGTSNQYISGKATIESTSNGSSSNTSKVVVGVYLKRNNSGYVSYGTLNTSVTCEGQSQSENGLYVELTEHGWTLVYAKSFTVSHNSDGSKWCSARTDGSSNFGLSFTHGFAGNLDKIPRYTSVTAWSLASVTNNSITLGWSAADPVSEIYCTINGVGYHYQSSLNTQRGSFTISGLSENTTYNNIKLRVKRYDSGLYSESGLISAKTNYTAPTASLSFQSNSINSITLKWNSNFNCSDIWIYNSGTNIYHASGLNASSGTVTLSPSNWTSISPGSSYNMTVTVKRKASGVNASSSSILTNTLSCPEVDSATAKSFNIGNQMTVYIKNSSTINSSLVFQAYSPAGSWDTVNTIPIAKGTASTIITPTSSVLYSKCPTSNTLSTRIACSSTNNNKTYTSYYYLTGSVTNSNPVFSGYSIKSNLNTTINNIIGGTTNLLTGTGNLQLILTANSATAKNHATINYLLCRISLSGKVYIEEKIAYSSDAFNYLIEKISALSIDGTYSVQMHAIDSRGNLSPVVSKSILVYKYQKPALNINMQRQNDFGSITYLTLKGEISKVTISSVQKNSIVSLKYRYAESGSTFPSTYSALTGYSSVTSAPDNLVISLSKNTDANNFIELNYEKSYVFQFILEDKFFQSTTYEVFVAQGKPAFATFGNGCTVVNKIPNFDSTAKLQVGSDILATDTKGQDFMVVEKAEELIAQLTSINTTLTNRIETLNNTVSELNRNIPITIFSGNKQLNDGGAWHSSLGFKEFSKIEMQVNFQGNNYVLSFFTQNKDTTVQSFCFTAYNATDGKCRILTGRFLFAGRYITDIKLFMSPDLQSFEQIDSGAIWVQQIVGIGK